MSGETGRRIRVAQVVNNLHYGGLERVVQDLIRCFPREAVDSHLLLLQYEGRYAAALSGQAEIHLLPPMRKLSLIHPVALTRLLRRIRPDVLHTHSGVWLKAARAGRTAGVPAQIHTDHGRGIPDPPLHRLLDRMASRYCDTVVAVSESVAQRLRSGIVARTRNVVVIPNGVNTEAFRPRYGSLSLRSELGLSENTPVVGSIGRLEPVKNYGLAIRAFAELTRLWQTEEKPMPVLLLAGDGSERSALARQAQALGIGSQVRFLGWRDDIHDLLDTFDLFTLSSRSEGTSMSLLEAMSSELPCVVTDVGGNRAVLGKDLVAALVSSEDPEALARAWLRVLTDAAGRTAFGRQARKRVVECFSSRRMAAQYLTLYHHLLSRPGNPALAAS